MPTTTTRLEEAIKARVAAAAEQAGKTAHSCIVDTISRTVEYDEADLAFHRLADERWETLTATGETVSWDEAKTWLEARSRGERVERPASRGISSFT